jgi:hypothetical protein
MQQVQFCIVFRYVCIVFYCTSCSCKQKLCNLMLHTSTNTIISQCFSSQKNFRVWKFLGKFSKMHKIAYEICKFFPGVIPRTPVGYAPRPPGKGKGKERGGGRDGRRQGEGGTEKGRGGGEEEGTRGCPPWLEILATPLMVRSDAKV